MPKQVLSKLLIPLLLSSAGGAHAQLLYDTEYPLMGYGKTAPTDSFTKAVAALQAANKTLPYKADERGYLDALLAELHIDPSSQVLVFSKSSLKQRFIEPKNPRSLYFNDEVYVGFVPGSRTLEIAAMDPLLGSVFFDLNNEGNVGVSYKQETSRCLRCHDSYSMTGGGVPRFMLSSVITGADGNTVSHELSEITELETPIARRFGGWYVTGTTGEQLHLGNFIVTDPAVLQQQPWHGVSNQQELNQFVDLNKYLRRSSDVVALLVLQHQVSVQNQLIRFNWESRKLLASDPKADLSALLQPLLRVLFMQDEAPLLDKVQGNAGYSEWFAKQGPQVNSKSLRDFDLQTRTFKYRLSYLIYSAAIDGLAAPAKQQLFTAIRQVLDGHSPLLPDSTLNADERASIKLILQATKPDVLAP